MKERARVLIAALAFAALFSGGCAYGELRHVLRAQFAAEHDCTEVKMVKRALWYAREGPDQYKISGCGVMRTYTCPKAEGLVSYDEPQCTWVEGDADAPTINRPEPADDVFDDEAGDADDEALGGDTAPLDEDSPADEETEPADAADE